MKWFKTVFLTGIMALVAWGVWRTLTDSPHTNSEETERPAAPKWGANSASGGSDASGRSVVVEMPGNHAAGGSSHRGEMAAHHIGSELTDRSSMMPGGIDHGPPIPTAQPGKEPSAPKFGANSDRADRSTVPGSLAASEDSIASRRRQMEFDSMMQRVKEQAAQRKYVKAHEELSQWYAQRDDLPEGRAAQMRHYLDRWSWKVVYSRDHALLGPHTVGQTDTLERVASVYGVPWELLAKINGVADPNRLNTGQQLKVIPGPFHVEIQLSKFELTLLLGKKRLYACRFKVGVGSQVPLKEGEYVVIKKIPNPEYLPEKVPGGDSLNPLGRKLVEFKSEQGDVGALHGTSDPASVGRSCKEGCVRLTPKDIDDVYDMLTVGASRIIVRR